MQQKLRTVIFDLDGTLLDTVKDIGAGANMALHRFGVPEQPLENYRTLVGHGIRNLIRLAVGQNTEEERYEKALQYYLEYYPQHCTDHTTKFPGVDELLQKLVSDGFAVGILSNKTETTTTRIIGHYFADVPFRLVWGNNGTRPLKPKLDAGYALLEELQCKPEEIMFVGDGDTDMEFASKMGFFAVGVTWGYRSRQQLLEAGAQILVDSMDEIYALLIK